MSNSTDYDKVDRVLGAVDMTRAYNSMGLGDVIGDVVTLKQAADALTRAIWNAAVDLGYVRVVHWPDPEDLTDEMLLDEVSVVEFGETYMPLIIERLEDGELTNGDTN